MTSWRKAVEDYVEMRRRLGFKLLDASVGLIDFASFLKQHRAARITNALAMEWAQQNRTARPAQWAKRLGFVRGFARHWSAFDSQTEIPPYGLLPHPIAADHAGNLGDVRVDPWRPGEESLEVNLLVDLPCSVCSS